MYDPLELPDPVRVVIPRIRNGEILTQPTGTDQGERARLLGIFAIVIAEVKNHTVHFNLNRDYIGEPGSYAELDSKVTKITMLDCLLEVMQILMDNKYDVFLLILDGFETQNDVERDALGLFSSFIRYELVTR